MRDLFQRQLMFKGIKCKLWKPGSKTVVVGHVPTVGRYRGSTCPLFERANVLTVLFISAKIPFAGTTSRLFAIPLYPCESGLGTMARQDQPHFFRGHAERFKLAYPSEPCNMLQSWNPSVQASPAWRRRCLLALLPCSASESTCIIYHASSRCQHRAAMTTTLSAGAFTPLALWDI